MAAGDELAYGSLGRAFTAEKKAREAAADACRRALAKNPRDRKAAVELAGLLAELGKKREALAAYDRALALAPNDAALHLAQGRLLLGSKQYRRALACADAALAAAPGTRAAVEFKAETLYRAKRYAEAADWCAAFAKKRWEDLHAYRGLALMDAGRLPEALAAFDQGLACAPKSAVLHFNRGCVFVRQGKIRAALAALKQAAALNPRVEGLAMRDNDFGPVWRDPKHAAAMQRALGIPPDWQFSK